MGGKWSKIDRKPKTDGKRIADISNAKVSKRIEEVVWKERRLFCRNYPLMNLSFQGLKKDFKRMERMANG